MPTTRHNRAGIDDRWHKRVKNLDGTTTKERSPLYGKVTRWRVRWVVDGREHSKVFDRQADAQRHLDGLTADVVRGDYISPIKSADTFGDVAAEWLQTKGTVKPKTLASYTSVLETLLLPRWGATKLSDIKHGDAQRWISQLSIDGSTRHEGRGLSASRIMQAHQVMGAVLKYAIKTDRLAKNPAADIALPRKVANKHHYLSHKELQRLASYAGRFETLTLVLGYCGLRFGEATALRRRDLDIRKKMLNVHASVTNVRGNGLVEGTTKTGRTRAVPVPGLVWDRLKNELPADPDALVFPGRDGGWLTTAEYRWVFDPAAEAIGKGGLVPHELRHTCASLAIRSKASVLVVQRLLGHASATMTLDTYGHLYNDDLTRVAKALDQAGRSVRVYDDLDLTRKTDADGTYRFGWDGVSYEIDLSQEHAERLHAALEPFIDAARRAGS